MPLYEYRCTSCEYDLEAIQKFSDAPLSDCPSCGKPELERLVSHSSFSLKGGGWYADGYGQKPEGSKKASSEGKTDAKSGDSAVDASKSGESPAAAESKTTAASPAPDKASNG